MYVEESRDSGPYAKIGKVTKMFLYKLYKVT